MKVIIEKGRKYLSMESLAEACVTWCLISLELRGSAVTPVSSAPSGPMHAAIPRYNDITYSLVPRKLPLGCSSTAENGQQSGWSRAVHAYLFTTQHCVFFYTCLVPPVINCKLYCEKHISSSFPDVSNGPSGTQTAQLLLEIHRQQVTIQLNRDFTDQLYPCIQASMFGLCLLFCHQGRSLFWSLFTGIKSACAQSFSTIHSLGYLDHNKPKYIIPHHYQAHRKTTELRPFTV